jgi:hypothetical protein
MEEEFIACVNPNNIQRAKEIIEDKNVIEFNINAYDGHALMISSDHMLIN